MKFAPKWRSVPLSLTVITALALAACGGTTNAGNPDDADTAQPATSGEAVAGEIFVSGSSTVEPISVAVAERFAEQNAEFDYTIEGPGTGDGFALFCNGETDMSNASRAISEEEAQACADNGIEYAELQVAIDGLSVITSADNTAVECLSFLDLYALVGPESEGFASWSDANELADELAGELGDEFGESHAPYPDAELVISGPGEESGTFDSFVEIALGDIAEAREQDETTRPDYGASANDNVIIESVAGTASSFGWVGLAFAEGAEGVREVPIDGGDGCVEPTPESVADGSYPISRPLFIYPNLAMVDENPALAAYVDFYLSDEGIAAVEEVGYVMLADEQLAETRSAWEDR